MKVLSVNGITFSAERKRSSPSTGGVVCFLVFAILVAIKNDCESKRYKSKDRSHKEPTSVEEHSANPMANIPIVWVLGGPGSGKGTQCEKIIQKYGFTHLSTGDLLRAEITQGTGQGQELKAIMERGELVPMNIVMKLLKDAMTKVAVNSTTTGFLIDGYPREKEQGLLFETEIQPCNLILYFEVSDDTMTKRLLGRAVSSGRADDNPETIKLRLQTFAKNNNQILEHFKDKLVRINAETEIDAIFGEVQKQFDLMLGALKEAKAVAQ